MDIITVRKKKEKKYGSVSKETIRIRKKKILNQLQIVIGDIIVVNDLLKLIVSYIKDDEFQNIQPWSPYYNKEILSKPKTSVKDNNYLSYFKHLGLITPNDNNEKNIK